MSGQERSWMYEGWKDNGRHSESWVRNMDAFLDHAFSRVPNAEKSGVPCPCSECRNRVGRKRSVMSMHLCKKGFMPGYTRWTVHGEKDIASSATPEQVSNTADEPDEMLAESSDAEEKEQAAVAKVFYGMLSASEEPLHHRTEMSQRTAVSQMMALKSRHDFSDECMDALLSLLDDVLPGNHKMPKSWNECKDLLKKD